MVDGAETLCIVSRATYHVPIPSITVVPAADLAELTLGPHTPPITVHVLLSLLHEARCLESVSVLGAPVALTDGDPIASGTNLATTTATNIRLDLASEVLGCILRSLCIPYAETLELVGLSGWFPLSDLFIFSVRIVGTIRMDWLLNVLTRHQASHHLRIHPPHAEDCEYLTLPGSQSRCHPPYGGRPADGLGRRSGLRKGRTIA